MADDDDGVGDPYRDERAAMFARVADLNERYAGARAEVVEIAAAVVEMNRADARHGKPPLPVREVPAAPARAALDATAPLAALVRRADDVDADLEQLAAARTDIERVLKLLVTRREGKHVVAPIGPAPRRVPLGGLLLELFPFRLTVVGLLFGGVLGGVSISVIWSALATEPPWERALLPLGALAVLALRALGYVRMLKWGQVATVTELERSPGSTRMTNWPVRRSHGWQVRTESYTGHAVVTRLQYATDDGYVGELEVSGAGYTDGVILYDARRPRRALPIEKFRSRPHPRADGSLAAGTWWDYANAIPCALAFVAATVYLLTS